MMQYLLTYAEAEQQNYVDQQPRKIQSAAIIADYSKIYDNHYLKLDHWRAAILFLMHEANGFQNVIPSYREHQENLIAIAYILAVSVAQGLAFLHDCSSGPIFLLDHSSKSILLKSMKEPKVGDIELCKVIDLSKSTGSLSTVAGSVGYIPPEYAYTLRMTTTGNVYSFRVVLVELLTGKPAVSEGTELAKWVLAKSSQWDRILDISVSRTSSAVRSQTLDVLKIALNCVSPSLEARPKMKSVLRMLLNAR
ncbi:leucine-rich repeat receptor-like tyrosine-protein kinase PXC3 [Punica granatum]|uniref:Leucine-rich repeat receptor-like tyrosine-protein kinase PXC3 n=1 Tax=Punica granatum TaxID=22663 RepID=A0A6P8D1Y7_PUNGR|nr:leucine-rich repeat receptor-like tyrosine-protein kinase PXC3 [Punica granatum]